jgi:DNA-binding transcriptional LysR family regulator
MRLDQLDGLVAFKEVAHGRSFTAAADALDVSTQAVSKAIKALESRLGVRLFNRTTRSVSLNEAGEALMARVGPALSDLFEGTDAVQEFRDRPAGVLRLAVSRPSFSALLLPRLAGFAKAYPDIKLDLRFDEAFVDIVAQGLDAGVRLGDSIALDMVSVKVTDAEPIAILASPDYLKRRGMPKSISELASHDCIRFRFPGSGALFRWELLDDGKPVEVEVPGVVTVNDAASMISCALQGLGIAYVIENTARSHIQDGSLKKVLVSAAPVLPGFHLYYPSRRQLPPKLRCFVDYMTGRAMKPSAEARRRPSAAGTETSKVVRK